MFIDKTKLDLDKKGKIIYSTANIIKMTFFECFIWNLFYQNNIKEILKDSSEAIKETFKNIAIFICALLIFLTFPISFPIISIVRTSYRRKNAIRDYNKFSGHKLYI